MPARIDGDKIGHIEVEIAFPQVVDLGAIAHLLKALELARSMDGRYRTAAGFKRRLAAGYAADDGNGAGLAALEGQQAAVVFEQHDTLARGVERCLITKGVIQWNGGIELRVLQEMEFDHDPQDAARCVVHHRHRYSAVLHGLHQPRRRRARRIPIHDVLARIDGGHLILNCGEVAGRAVVGHGDAFKTPFSLQHRLHQEGALRAEHAVQLVVGEHDRTNVAFLDCRLKGRKINFVQGPLVDNGVNRVTLVLLVVSHEVFDGGYDPLVLRPADLGHHHAAAQKRVFAAEVFGVAPSHGHPVHVGAGAVPDSKAAGASIAANAYAFVAGALGIPRGGQEQVGRVAGTGSAVDADAHGAVAVAQLRQA